MKNCSTCGKETPAPFVIDVGNGYMYCSYLCYINSLLSKQPKIIDYEYPDNRRDDMPYNEDDGC